MNSQEIQASTEQRHASPQHYLSVAFGGPGFTMPFSLLMGGVSLVAAFMKLLPKWVVTVLSRMVSATKHRLPPRRATR